MTTIEPIPLPRGWTKTVRSGVLHAVALASVVLTRAWGAAAQSHRHVQVIAERDRARTEIALLREELAIKDARWSRVPPRRRPYYTPVQRMQILKLKAARGWSTSQVAEVFAVTEETIDSWLKRLDEEGERALVQISEPVNRFPDFVRYLIRQLKMLCPMMGKVRIAEVLARAGLHLGATTVGRILKETGPVPEDVEAVLEVIERRKNECVFRILVPLRLDAMRRELRLYAVWYYHHRPSQALDGGTPWEVYVCLRPANAKPRFEPRENWSTRARCTSPQTAIRGTRGTKLALVVGYVEGRRHRPIVELREAA